MEGVLLSFYFTRKITSCACLMGSEIKVIFYWLAHAFILLKLLFKLVAEKFTLLTTEKNETSPAKRLCCEAFLKIVYLDNRQ